MSKVIDINRDANRRVEDLDSLDLDQDVKSRLSINLNRITEGNSDVYETPISKEHGADRILAEWSKIFDANREVMNDTLIDLDESQKSKTGPRSIALPWSKRREQVRSYFELNDIDYSPLNANPEALSHKGKLRPIEISNAIKLLKNDTNSGLPYYTRKGKVKERVLARFSDLLESKYPCVLFTRTQEQGKTRDVWGYPIADTLNEMMFYKPLLDYQRRLSWRNALNGPDFVSRKLTHIIDKAKLEGLVLISVDFSNYDRSIKEGFQRKINEYYKYLFQDKFHSRLDYICDRKINIPLLTPDGIIRGPHGEPSGSTFTNEDDSIGQFITSRSSGALIRDLFDIQGDDGVYAVKAEHVNKFITNFRRYGLDVNESKSYKSNDYLIYLQNLFHSDYRKKGVINGIYPSFRALNRILYQERWSNFEDYDITGKDYYSIRTISILENCRYHPLFEKLVSFVLKYDKYKLKPSKQSIIQYIKMLDESSGVEGLFNNQLGDNIKGINSFETVKLIRRLTKG